MLDNYDADIVLSGVNLTPERAQKYALTKPYLSSEWAILSSTKKPAYTQLNQLNNQKVAVLGGSASIKKLETYAPSANITTFDTVYRGVMSTESGRSNAILDMTVVLQQYEGKNLRLSPIKSLGKAQFVFALHKDNPVLRKKLDQGLAAIKKDGTYDLILKKWGLDS